MSGFPRKSGKPNESRSCACEGEQKADVHRAALRHPCSQRARSAACAKEARSWKLGRHEQGAVFKASCWFRRVTRPPETVKVCGSAVIEKLRRLKQFCDQVEQLQTERLARSGKSRARDHRYKAQLGKMEIPTSRVRFHRNPATPS